MGIATEAPEGLDLTCLAAKTLAAEVRHRLELRLARWELTRLAQDACLIADELVSNACAATPDSEIRIRVVREPMSVLLGVWDHSEQMPVVKPMVELTLDDLDLSEANFDENGGWGLPLVRALASQCGTSTTRPSGKWVWARLAIP